MFTFFFFAAMLAQAGSTNNSQEPHDQSDVKIVPYTTPTGVQRFRVVVIAQDSDSPQTQIQGGHHLSPKPPVVLVKGDDGHWYLFQGVVEYSHDMPMWLFVPLVFAVTALILWFFAACCAAFCCAKDLISCKTPANSGISYSSGPVPPTGPIPATSPVKYAAVPQNVV